MSPTKLEPADMVDAVHTRNGVDNEDRGRVRDRRGRSRILAIAALLLLIAAGAWAYRANFGSGQAAMDMNMRITSGNTPFPVVLTTVTRGAVSGSVTYTGSVAPLNEQDVYPRVTGRIVEVLVYPGDTVRAGQVVARLDDVELTSRVREAEAGAAGAQAGRAQMAADLAGARQGIVQMERELAMVDAELTYAAGVAARSERLLASGAIARQEYENDRSMASSLRAKREAAQAKLEQARAMETAAQQKVAAAESMVTQSRAALRTATVVRDYVTIVAPTSGVVVKRLIAPGVLVQPGMPILKIAQIERVRLQANVGEKDFARIKVGSPVMVATTATSDAAVPARVTAVFPYVDQGARTAVVEAAVDNAARRFLPGQYVTMQFVIGERAEALTVPRGAVARMGGRATVWVMRDGRVEPRQVVTGLESADAIEVTSGLMDGERIVVRGHEMLYAGARIAEVATPGAPGAAGTSAAPPAAPMAPMPPAGGAQGGTEADSATKGGAHAGHGGHTGH